MFQQRPMPQHRTLAFLPHTLESFGQIIGPLRAGGVIGPDRPEYHGSSAYRIGAYWHEYRRGLHMTACGIVNIVINNEHLPADRHALTYERMLEVVDAQRDLIRGYVGMTLGARYSHGEPEVHRFAFATNGKLTLDAFDLQALVYMQADETHLPGGSDGWYSKKRGVRG